LRISHRSAQPQRRRHDPTPEHSCLQRKILTLVLPLAGAENALTEYRARLLVVLAAEKTRDIE
jgi:hypothetical protein